MKVLYVTSFIPPMYAMSARNLISSFQATSSGGSMLLCHEGFYEGPMPGHPTCQLPKFPAGFHSWDLGESAWLKEWLERFSGIIPVRLGGKAARCRCPYPDNPQKPHKKRCPGWWWNKNASRWFRKIVCLRHAMENYSADALIWIDCDVSFVGRRLKTDTVREWFHEKDVFFLQNRRRHPETGIVGYNMRGKGRQMIELLVEWYDSGKFHQEHRWDDCWQLMTVLGHHPEISRIDLAYGVASRGQVIPTSPLRQYFTHTKGRHKRAKVI